MNQDGSEAVPPRRFLDWPNNDNPVAMHAGLQGLLCRAFQCGAKLCGALGIDASRPLEFARRMMGHVPDCGDSKAAAAMLTLSGIADRSDVLARDPFRGVSTFYGYYMLLAQPTAPALELIRRFWGGMLDYGATTFWEDFDLDWLKNTSPISELPVPGKDDLHADFGKYCYRGLRHSLCHGWASGPTSWLSRHVLGFYLADAETLVIEPHLGSLEWAEGSFPTAKGVVQVRHDKGPDGRVNTSVKAPEGLKIIVKKPTEL